MALSNKLNDLKIKKMKPSEKDTWHRDGDGLALRVYPTGAKVWHYIYTNADGKKRYQRLGEYQDLGLSAARQMRDDLRKQVSTGVDTVVEKRQEKHKHKTAKTISDLVTDYITKYAKIHKPNSWHEDERILNKDIVPLWGERKAKGIAEEDIIALIALMKPRGDAITLNTYKIVRKMFKYAIRNKIIQVSPCEFLTQSENDIPTVASREEVLSEPEIKILWEGLDGASMSDSTRRAIKMILVTCQRPGEVASMHTSEISGRWWEFPPKQTRITKVTPRKQRMYLNDTAIKLIGDADGYVFPSHIEVEMIVDGKTVMQDKPVLEKSIAYAIRKNIKGYTRQRPAKNKEAGDIPKMVRVKESRKIDIKHFRPHDLRRTGSTKFSEMGFTDEIIDAVLAHLKQGTITPYNRNKYDKEKKEVMIAWEHKLKDILAGKFTDKNEDPVTIVEDYSI
jgi:integrase